MKKFTVKDFILYNSPCFNCGGQNNFYFEIDPADPAVIVGRVSKRALVTASCTEVELVVHYSKNLKIRIDNRTNMFNASNLDDFKHYLKIHKLSMRISCSRCFAEVHTSHLEFNLDKFFIHPATLMYEVFIVKNDKKEYHFQSLFDQDYSYLTLTSVALDKKIPAAFRVKLPLMPIYKFKTKEKFLKKIKTYVLFS